MTMDFIRYFSDYSTGRDMTSDMILEGRGIPNVLKEYAKKITTEIINSTDDEKEFKLIDVRFPLNLSLKILPRKKTIDRGLYATAVPTEIGTSVMSGTMEIHGNIEHASASDIEGNVMHELLHLYDLHKRNSIEFPEEWDVSKYIREEGKKIDALDWRTGFLSHFIYLSLDHEIAARIASAYPILYSEKSPVYSVLISVLKKTTIWKTAENMQQFRIPSYDKKTMGMFFDGLYKIEWSSKKVARMETTDETVRSWIKYINEMGEYYMKKLSKVITEVSDDVEKVNNMNESELLEYGMNILNSKNS